MKRGKPMKRTGFKRKATTGGSLSTGGWYIAHGDRPMDAKGKAALANIMEAAGKQLARTPMRRRSKRMAEIYANTECGMCRGDGEITLGRSGVQQCTMCGGTGKIEGRAAFVERILKERPICEAGGRIVDHDPMHGHHTARISVDVHELAKRSHTGSKRKREILTDEANVLAVCRACHDWIETHGKEAIRLGLGKSRYAGRNP